jgi:tetratricopeptide (TPR) repeat protein
LAEEEPSEAPAAAIALGGDAEQRRLDPRAAAYLEKQARLTELQIADLEREDAIRHWSLRVRHISDILKLTFELAIAGVVVALVLLICATVWEAARDNSLVVEAFSVPPNLAARGLTGQAVAAQVQDNLSAMQAATLSARPASSYANNWGDDIKVQIPDTGMSVSEFYRLLVSWIGHQTHISGEVWRNGGQIVVMARVGANPASKVTGTETNLSALFQQVAEKIYARTQPYRYSAYLIDESPANIPEARKIYETLIANSDRRERAWAWVGLASIDYVSARPYRAIVELHKAAELAPAMAVAYTSLDDAENSFGHDEAELEAARNSVRLLKGTGDADIDDRARAIYLANEEGNVAFETGDLQSALAYCRKAKDLPDFYGGVESGRESEVVTLGFLHDAAGERRAVQDFPPAESDVIRYERVISEANADFGLGNWRAVLAWNAQVERAHRKYYANLGVSPAIADRIIKTQWWPYLAIATAMTGNIEAAHTLMNQTPTDCYACVRGRALVDATGKDWRGAAYWFAVAVKQAPSIPLAYAQWGGMLLAEGDTDGAIAKFAIANRKGPHFADPLEMWGEALIRKNRSDLALAKFEEAGKYAPNWGRLHLKWGEALWWAGDQDGARKQWAVARKLALTPTEKSEMTRLAATH